jgi:hypothetical protein
MSASMMPLSGKKKSARFLLGKRRQVKHLDSLQKLAKKKA